MNIEKILEEIDVLYSQQKVEEVEALLLEKIEELKKTRQVYPAISFMNELLGIYREKGDQKSGEKCSTELLSLFEEFHLKHDENYGTTLLNIATAYRSFGDFSLSKEYYDQCFSIYQGKIPENDYRFASLYNNMSLLYSEMEDFQGAIDSLKNSLEILKVHENVEIQIATAHTSLAQIYINLNDLQQAKEYSELSLDMFQKFEDYHYSAALATAASIEFLLENYEKSASLYKKAMVEIEKYLGKTENYKMLEESLEEAKKMIPQRGLSLSRQYYQEFGIPMIQLYFPEYEDEIAAGLVGEGSECFGFDDKISEDHDYFPDFCLWLPMDIYQKIGRNLQEKYDKLPKKYKGFVKNTSNTQKRRGVFEISSFYSGLLGGSRAPIFNSDWFFLQDEQLAQVTNGEIFRDDLGEFTKIRNMLKKHYPISAISQKLADKVHLVSQKGQYNFPRMKQREDIFTAKMILSEFISDTMDLMFLLNKEYAPFYKWKHKSAEKLEQLSNILPYLEQLTFLDVESNEVEDLIEKIVAEIILELKAQKYIKTVHQGNFLDVYVNEIATMSEKMEEFLMEKGKLVSEVVQMEWNAFDKVQGMDGRAGCQDDFETFQIMRSSQFIPWDLELLQSYHNDFQVALGENRNLISEKYAYMMSSTDPDYFSKIQHRLPSISAEKLNLIEKIIAIQLNDMTILAKSYPKFANQGRSLRSSEDTTFNTSYETYLRGELSTYSQRTVELYLEFLQNNQKNIVNTAELYMKEVATQYGYPDLLSAENSIN